MSGHSKGSTIKRKKAKTDAQKGRIFTRLIKEITIAARTSGGDENSNPTLRTAILAAKAANMPAANIDRAIKRGTGELPGVVYESVTYEGYGPGGTALMIEVLTDNKNRTVAEIRHILSRHNGNLGESGCVSWIFEKKGVIQVSATQISEEKLFELVLEAGADDLRKEDDMFEIIAHPNSFENAKSVLKNHNIEVESAELTMNPRSTIKVEAKEAEQMLRLMDELEEQDDVNNIYSNVDIDDEILKELEAS